MISSHRAIGSLDRHGPDSGAPDQRLPDLGQLSLVARAPSVLERSLEQRLSRLDAGSAASRRQRFGAATSPALRRPRCARRPQPHAPLPAACRPEPRSRGRCAGAARPARAARAPPCLRSPPAPPAPAQPPSCSPTRWRSPALVQRIRELEAELEPLGRVLRQQRARALEEVDGRRRVSASDRAPPGGGEQLPAARGERHPRLVDALDLGAVAERLLEVVAEHLLHLGAAVAGRYDEPVREPLVQLGPDLLRQAVIGGVPDQDVPEAEGVLARERRPLLADQLLAQQRAEGRRRPARARARRGAPRSHRGGRPCPPRPPARSPGARWRPAGRAGKPAAPRCWTGSPGASRSGATHRPFSWRSAPSSISIEIISSTKSGLPSGGRLDAAERLSVDRAAAEQPLDEALRLAARTAARGRWPLRCACRRPRRDARRAGPGAPWPRAGSARRATSPRCARRGRAASARPS